MNEPTSAAKRFCNKPGLTNEDLFLTLNYILRGAQRVIDADTSGERTTPS